MMEPFEAGLYIFGAVFVVPPLLYVAFRMASAGWHRSQVEIERRYKQGENTVD